MLRLTLLLLGLGIICLSSNLTAAVKPKCNPRSEHKNIAHHPKYSKCQNNQGKKSSQFTNAPVDTHDSDVHNKHIPYSPEEDDDGYYSDNEDVPYSAEEVYGEDDPDYLSRENDDPSNYNKIPHGEIQNEEQDEEYVNPSIPQSSPSKALTLTIVHTNDIHAHLDEFNKYGTDCHPIDIENKECFGGIARIKTVFDHFKREKQDVVFFDAGDQFQGTLFYNVYKGEKISYMMNNILNYDVMTLGNHEFDDGEEYLSEFLMSLKFPVIASNIDFDTAPHLKKAGVKPYIVIEKYNIGVIGFITNSTASLTFGARHITFVDPVFPVQKAVDELHAKGIKKIVCVSHNGYLSDQYLAQNTHGINLIVGGHSHSLLANHLDDGRVVGPFPTKITNKKGGQTYIVQAQKFGNFVGHVDLTWDENEDLIDISGDPILMDYKIKQHPKTRKIVKDWRKPFDAKTKEIVASLTKDMPLTDCKYHECLLGNFISDAMLDSTLDAEIALINDGGMRAGILAGAVSVADVMTVLPFPNTVITLDLSGQEILEILENISAEKTRNDRLVSSLGHWSMLHYSYNMSMPFFSRVVDTQVKDRVTGEFRPLDLKRTYKVATLDFLAYGGDNFMEERSDIIPGTVIFELVDSFIREKLSIINPSIEGRIIKLE